MKSGGDPSEVRGVGKRDQCKSLTFPAGVTKRAVVRSSLIFLVNRYRNSDLTNSESNPIQKPIPNGNVISKMSDSTIRVLRNRFERSLQFTSEETMFFLAEGKGRLARVPAEPAGNRVSPAIDGTDLVDLRT